MGYVDTSRDRGYQVAFLETFRDDALTTSAGLLFQKGTARTLNRVGECWYNISFGETYRHRGVGWVKIDSLRSSKRL